MKQVNSNYLEARRIPWCYRENCTKLARTGRGFLINLDDKGNPGTHWTAARVIDGILYYADPFGSDLNGWPPEEFKAEYPKQIISSKTFQRPESELCGYYAILFVKAMDEISSPVSQKVFETILHNVLTQ